MGSTSKKGKRHRHRSRSNSSESPQREKRHKRHHRHHHRERKRDAKPRHNDYESGDSDVVCVSPTPIHKTPAHKTSGDKRPAHKRQASPHRHAEEDEGKKQSAESLSVHETNKLRAKLGLKPLEVNTTSSSSSSADKNKRKDDLGEFYHKPAGNLGQKAETEKIKRKLDERKEKRKLEKGLLKTKTLGESDVEDDANAWIEKTRKIEEEKKQAQKRAKMLEELDEEFGVGDVVESEMRRRPAYSSKHLTGLQVNHKMEAFEEGRTVVLTLKDRDVLAEDDDVLVNVNMIDDERYEKSNLNKKFNPATAYQPYDIEEVDELGMVKRKALLNKYDEVIDGDKEESFKIGLDNSHKREAMIRSIKDKLANKRVESLALPELKLTSDYYTEEEIKFKKPKKKVKKLRQKGKILTADELEEMTRTEKGEPMAGSAKSEAMDIDDLPAVDAENMNIKVENEDEEWLQKALHRTRKKNKKPELSTFALPTVAVKEEPLDASANGETSNIILNSTAEFCRTLGDIPTYGKSGNRDEEENMLDFEQEQEEEMEAKEEDDDEVGTWNSVEPGETRGVIQHVQVEAPILDVEPDVGCGVGAALRLAMSKGYLDKEDNNRPSNSRFAHLQAKHYSIEDKTFGEDDKFGGRRERYSGPTQDFKEKDTFKPNVKLEYIDDDGHVLNPKEAFRYLSHKFHGKGPGKNKIEKRLKKSEQEGLMKKMSSTDTPLGTLNMLQSKQKEMQSPYIVLSGSKHTLSTISKARR